MFFCPNVFLYAAIVVVAFLSMLMVGVGCVKLLPELYFGKNPLANVFVCLMSGYITVITLFALIVARCNSVMLLSVIIILFYFLLFRNKCGYEKNKKCVIDKNFVKYSLLTTCLLLVMYLISYYIFFIMANGEIWCDYTFYSNVSCHVFRDRCENTDLYSNFCIATNYHWGDLWLTSLFGSLFKANYLYVLLLVTYPCLSLVCIVGGASIIYHMTNNLVSSIVSGVGILFAVPILTVMIHWSSPIVIGSKLIVIYCFIVLSLLFYRNGKWKLSYIALLLLVPFYSTVASGVLTMVCVLSIIEERNKGKNWLQCMSNRVVLLSVLVAAFYVVFYYLQNNGGDGHLDLLYDDYLKNIAGFVAKRSLRVALLVPSVVGLWYVFKTKKDRESVVLLHWLVAAVFGVVVSSVVGGCAKQVMLDGGQITTNYSIPIFNIACWFSVVFLFSKVYHGKYFNAVVISVVAFYVILYVLTGSKEKYVGNNIIYTEDEINKIEALRNEVNSGECAIGYYRNYELDENFNTQKSRIRMCYPMNKMPHLLRNGYYAPYCLSALDIPDDLEPRWNEKEQSQLYKFKEQQNADGMFVNEELLIRKFISEKNIKFIVIENGCDMPNYLQGHVVNVYNGKDKVYKICN